MQIVAVTCVVCVVGAVLWRVASNRATPALRTIGTVASIAVPLVIGGWYLAGPARHGWAARAGTPKSLLARTTATAVARSAVTASVAEAPTQSFTGTFNGSVKESSPDANGRVPS